MPSRAPCPSAGNQSGFGGTLLWYLEFLQSVAMNEGVAYPNSRARTVSGDASEVLVGDGLGPMGAVAVFRPWI